MHLQMSPTRTRRKLLLLVSLLTCLPALAQSVVVANAADTREAAEGVVAALAAGKNAEAIKQLRSFSPHPEQQLDVFEAQFAGQLAEIRRRVGDAVGHEYLRSDQLGTRLVRHQFLVHHSRGPIRWALVFYRSAPGWVLSDVRFDGNPLDMFNAPTGQLRPQ
jgi:hypothetical protein